MNPDRGIPVRVPLQDATTGIHVGAEGNMAGRPTSDQNVRETYGALPLQVTIRVCQPDTQL